MRRTEFLQSIRQMNFEDILERTQRRDLSQSEPATTEAGALKRDAILLLLSFWGGAPISPGSKRRRGIISVFCIATASWTASRTRRAML